MSPAEPMQTAAVVHHRLRMNSDGHCRDHNILAEQQSLIQPQGISAGLLVAMSQHTTTALLINQVEERLLRSIKSFILELAPGGVCDCTTISIGARHPPARHAMPRPIGLH